MPTTARRIYCVDASSLIYCQKSFAERVSRRTFFSAVWDLLDQLAADERLIAPYPVHREVTMNKDQIGIWAEAHPAVFRPKGEFAARVIEILKEPAQRLVDPTAPRGAEESDPWVIALAEGITAVAPALFDAPVVGIVVSEETKAGGIRDICRRRRVEHLDFTEMMAAEGLALGPATAS